MIFSKRYLILLILFSIILMGAISSITATEITGDIQNCSDEEIQAVVEDEVVSMQDSNQEVLGDSTKTFEDLNNLINGNSNPTITLTDNYISRGLSDFSEEITINRTVTIDGNGHYISGYNNIVKCFKVTARNVVFKNITFMSLGKFENNQEYLGGAIYSTDKNLNTTVIDSTFNNCQAYKGGATYNVNAQNCVFKDCGALHSGGAMYLGNAINCYFKSNYVKNYYGGGKYGDYAINCTFEQNNAQSSGGGMYSGTIVLCNFKDNTAQNGKDYQGSIIPPLKFDIPSEMTVVYPSNVSIPIDLYYDGLSGEPNFPRYDFNGYDVKLTIYKNGEYFETYDCLSGLEWCKKLDMGTYTFNLTLNTSYLNKASGSGSFQVKNIKTNLSCENMEIIIGEDKNLTILLLDEYNNALKNFNITVSNSTYSKVLSTDSKGRIEIPLKDLPIGSYQYDLLFSGYDGYESSSKTINIVVNGIGTKLSTEDVYAFYNEGKIISYLKDENNNSLSYFDVYLEVGNLKQTKKTDNDGKVEFNLTGLTKGNYSATIKFNGTDIYSSSFNQINVKIDQLDTQIVTDTLSFVYNESENLTVRLTDSKGTPIPDASLRIILNFIDENLTTDSNGEVQLPLNKLPCGTFDGNISYEGKTRFAGSNASIKVIINKIPTQIAAFDMICNYGDGSYFTATLKDKYGNPLNNSKITLNVNGKTLTNISNETGEAKFLISLPAGTHEAEVIFDGNDTYNASSTTVSITVKPASVGEASKITVKNTISQYNEGKYLIATLSDINGNIISGANVKVSLNGKNYVLTTDLNGQVKVSLNNLNPAKYNAKITYDGDNKHFNTSLSADIVILKATPKLVAKNKSFKVKTKTKKYAVTLKTNNGKKLKKAKLTLKVKGKIYRAVTNSKGKATFKITKLTKKGKFKALIKFSGDKNYKKVYKKVKIRVR